MASKKDFVTDGMTVSEILNMSPETLSKHENQEVDEKSKHENQEVDEETAYRRKWGILA